MDRRVGRKGAVAAGLAARRGSPWIALAAVALGLVALGLAACATPHEDSQGPLAIIGSYTDEFGTAETITQTAWSDGYGDVWHIAGYSNANRDLIAQNDAANAFNPGLWSRFDWATYQGHLYYCQTAYAAPTELAADQTPAADATSPATGGCGGSAFAWTRLN